jgi:hypothetical protein
MADDSAFGWVIIFGVPPKVDSPSRVDGANKLTTAPRATMEKARGSIDL